MNADSTYPVLERDEMILECVIPLLQALGPAPSIAFAPADTNPTRPSSVLLCSLFCALLCSCSTKPPRPL
eukprot:694120-Rhodomonas_salina.2